MRPVIITILIMILTLNICGEDKKTPPPRVGSSMADAAFFDLDANRQQMADVKTEYVVVIFWAFWCDTWEKALPYIKELSAKQKELDFTLWTVSIDGQRTEEIRPLVKKKEIPFPVLLDDTTWSQKLGIRRVPTVIILNKERKSFYIREGYPGNFSIEKAVTGGNN